MATNWQCIIVVSVNDKFSKLSKSYLGEDTIYSFINSVIKESKYCTNVMKKYLRKECVINKKGW